MQMGQVGVALKVLLMHGSSSADFKASNLTVQS